MEKEVETIRYVSIEKGEIEKVNLGFGNCLIKYGFLERVFRGATSVEEIMMGEENNGGKSPRVRSKYYTNRSTLKDPNQKLIKITNLLMENCTIIDDRVMDLETLER